MGCRLGSCCGGEVLPFRDAGFVGAGVCICGVGGSCAEVCGCGVHGWFVGGDTGCGRGGYVGAVGGCAGAGSMGLTADAGVIAFVTLLLAALVSATTDVFTIAAVVATAAAVVVVFVIPVAATSALVTVVASTSTSGLDDDTFVCVGRGLKFANEQVADDIVEASAGVAIKDWVSLQHAKVYKSGIERFDWTPGCEEERLRSWVSDELAHEREGIFTLFAIPRSFTARA